MRYTERQFKDKETEKLSREIAAVFSNISADNMKTVEIKGTTNPAANTSTMFRHGMGQVPSLWFLLEGRIYVPQGGASENNIDVRSTVGAENFRLIVVA